MSDVEFEKDTSEKKLLGVEKVEQEDLPFEVQEEYLKQTMRKKYRFVCLILTCLFVLGSYFCYDNPGSLEI